MLELCTYQCACPFFCKGRSPHEPCIRGSAPLHRQSPAARETAALRQSPSEQEEERLACRRQDISPCWACRCCAHFLYLFPAVSGSVRSAGVELAPPSIIILPSPATRPPSADNRTSPRVPSAFALQHRLRPSVISNPLSFFLLYDFHIFLLSICSPTLSLPNLPFYFGAFHFFSCVAPRTAIFFTQARASVTLRPFVEAAADLWITREAPHTHRCLCRPIPFIQTALSNFEPGGGLMCVRMQC